MRGIDHWYIVYIMPLHVFTKTKGATFLFIQDTCQKWYSWISKKLKELSLSAQIFKLLALWCREIRGGGCYCLRSHSPPIALNKLKWRLYEVLSWIRFFPGSWKLNKLSKVATIIDKNIGTFFSLLLQLCNFMPS